MVASLSTMSFNFEWEISPVLSGWLLIRSGFTDSFLFTIATYSLAVLLHYLWHSRGDRKARVVLAG